MDVLREEESVFKKNYLKNSVDSQKKTLLSSFEELQAGDDFARKFAHCNLIDNKIKKGQAVQIMTGAALPKGCNQVIPVENLVFENKEVFLKEFLTKQSILCQKRGRR